MANDISGYNLSVAAPVSRRESASTVKDLQTKPVDRIAPGNGPSGPGGTGQQRAEKGSLQESVQDLNNLVQELQRELNFSVDEASGEMVVKVVDRETEEVVRQIPAEEVLRLRQRLEQATGALFSDKV
jgi:flagellar protein FlaG